MNKNRKRIMELSQFIRTTILVSLSVLTLSSFKGYAQDTLHIHFRGECKEWQKYRLTFDGKSLGVTSPFDSTGNFSFVIDTNSVKPYDQLNLDIYRLNRITRSFKPVEVNFFYDPKNRHIHIYHVRYNSRKKRLITYNFPFERSVMHL